jgi:hypothetical protein
MMEFDGSAFEVEFSHQDGTSYARKTIPATKLLLLHYELLESVGRFADEFCHAPIMLINHPPTQGITPITHRRPTVKFN